MYFTSVSSWGKFFFAFIFYFMAAISIKKMIKFLFFKSYPANVNLGESNIKQVSKDKERSQWTNKYWVHSERLERRRLPKRLTISIIKKIRIWPRRTKRALRIYSIGINKKMRRIFFVSFVLFVVKILHFIFDSIFIF